MKIKLYKPFEHWYHGGTIWLISDTHFADPDCEYMNDHWPTPEEHIKIINKYVGKNDTLIHLGDVGDLEYIKKIKNCYKVLIIGNHDKGYSNYEKKYVALYKMDGYPRRYFDIFGTFNSRDEAQATIDEYNSEHSYIDFIISDNRLFDEVYEGPIFINEKICLSHEPIDLKFGINIYGHVHQGERSISWANSRAQINVCSDVRDFKPVRLDDLISEFKTIDLHRVTIDKAKKNR